jgi:cytochrome d ubiquinol oxidase subunit II
MQPEDIVAGVAVVALMAYAIFGGADFGGGVWTALAFGRRRKEVQKAISQSMGPVWETNHVWLILILVTLWTGFPSAFAALFENLFIPLTIALIGIVFRGAAFAFRHYGEHGEAGLPATDLIFSMASIVTPFAMGVALGAVAYGRVDTGPGPSDAFDAWLHPFPLLIGVVALAVCAFLTPFYMLERPLGDLRPEFRRMAFAASIALGGITTLAIPVAAWDAPDFFDRLTQPASLALIAAAVLLGLLSLVVLGAKLRHLEAPVAAGTVVAVIAAWAMAMHPYIILPSMRVSDAAASDSVLRAFLFALPVGAAILVPSLVFLYSLFATAHPTDVEVP